VNLAGRRSHPDPLQLVEFFRSIDCSASFTGRSPASQ
jgi:hypothetical protein